MPQYAFVGQVFMFTGNFAMSGTAVCNGQLLSIAQNTALFSILGTYYGGDGRSTFALPNLQGMSPIHPNGSLAIGESTGSATVTLQQQEIPVHTHDLGLAIRTAGAASTANPVNALPATAATANLYSDTAGSGFMAPFESTLDPATGIAGSSSPHNNMQPYLTVTFVIALQGVFPPRS